MVEKQGAAVVPRRGPTNLILNLSNMAPIRVQCAEVYQMQRKFVGS